MNALQFFTDRNCFPACDPLDILHRPTGADLFELQMFLVDLGSGQNTWYDSLENVESRKKHYFKGWSGLTTHLQGTFTPSAQLEILITLVIL